jgi:PKD repeat protein
MKRYLSLLILLTQTGCDLFRSSVPQPPPRVTLSASRTDGEVPFAVTFTATASPPADTFLWVVGGKAQEEASDTLTTTFSGSGLYVVSVSANGASDSVTVEATAPDLPNTGPSVGELNITQTPGGPAPWAVAYTVDPAVDGVGARCAEGAGYRPIQAGRFACLHEPGDTVAVRYVDAAGNVTARAETSAEVAENDGVAFAGRWRYSSRGVTETFEITEGSKTAGRSADGRFELFTIRQKGLTVAEFTVDGRTVVLEPAPEADGRQVFGAGVYGLVLESIPEAD